MEKIKNRPLVWRDRLNKAKTVEELRQSLRDNYPSIDFDQLKQLIVLGAAMEGQRLLRLCRELSIEVLAVCDDNPAKQGLWLEGHPVQPLSILENFDKTIPVIVATHRVLGPVRSLRKNGHTAVAAFAVLEVLRPDLFPPHLFYSEWLESLMNNRESINALKDLLADEKSRQVLDAIIGFRLTLDPEVLAPIVDWDLYGSEDILNLSDEEIYIDGGTYDGDTIKSFIERVNGRFKKVIGFEPDTQTYQRLQKNFSHESRVEVINKGLYSHEDVLYFDNVGTRASMLTNEPGGVAVPVASIDETLQGKPVTLIKMNIEGAEIPALNGAAKSIADYKPKLGISVYHRTADLWEIPFLVKKLHPDYRLYLRQHDGGVIESVLYAV